jgi:hypothetical protein
MTDACGLGAALRAKGVELEDSAGGTKWKVV